MKTTKILVGLALSACAALQLARGQAWPERPVTLVVPFAPGASADGLARLLAPELSSTFGKPFVVDNKPGAGGATGLIMVARAAADGYTFGMGATGAVVVNPHIPDAPPLNALRQLAPVAKIADIPLVLVASAKSGLKTVAQVVEAARERPATLAFGSNGNYTAQHLSGELFSQAAKVRLIHAPYRGSAPAVNDALAGTIPLAVVDLTAAYPHVRAGTLNAIGVTSPTRSVAAPEVPTLAEGGLAGYAATAWMGVFGPTDLPPMIVAKLSLEIKNILARPDIQSRVLSLGAEPSYLDEAAFRAFIAAESHKWKALVAAAAAQR